MRRYITIIGFVISLSAGFYLNTFLAMGPATDREVKVEAERVDNMELGAFSISLNVKDLKTSKDFYEKLGFVAFAGSMEQNYLIMKNGNALIGIFQGMFEGNILTFNPGWDENANNLESFDDIREIQKQLKSNKLILTSEADEKSEGPASLSLIDPDGNMILLDQHR